MGDYPKTLLDFEKRFTIEEACRDYLCQLRWPEGIYCPRCSRKRIRVTNRKLHRCCQCQYKFSVTAGSISQDTRISLRRWFRIIWQVVSQKQGISALGLQKILGFCRYETIWSLLHKLRIAMVRPGRDRLVWTVQVDEIYIGGRRPGKHGRGAEEKTLVLIAVEDKDKRSGRIRLHNVNDASAESLTPAVKESVEPGSEVCTDDWNGYEKLSSSGYHHTIIRKTMLVKIYCL